MKLMHWLSVIAMTYLFDRYLQINVRSLNEVISLKMPRFKKMWIGQKKGRGLVQKGYLIEL